MDLPTSRSIPAIILRCPPVWYTAPSPEKRRPHGMFMLLRSMILAALVGLPLSAAAAPPFNTTWGSAGSGDGQFNFAHHLALSPSSDVYVGDLLNNRIQQFTSDGVYV